MTMMRQRLFLALCGWGIFMVFVTGLFMPSYSQSTTWIGPLFDRENSFRQNSISVIGASDQGIWIGPGLEYSKPPFLNWDAPNGLDSVNLGTASLFSIDLNDQLLVAGLGATTMIGDETVPRAAGYGISQDMGESWTYQSFALDPEPDPVLCPDPSLLDTACDLSFSYGTNEYRRVRITVPEQSPPYDLFFHNNAIYAAHWASGIKISRDLAATWQFVPLPPQSTTQMTPTSSTSWTSNTSSGSIDRYDPRSDNNLLGFSVHVDDQDNVYVGTAGGLNVSQNLHELGPTHASWVHHQANGSSRGLLGNWIIRIRQDKETGDLWMTNWPTSASERYGLVQTSDGGATFNQHLIGQKVNDIGFIGSTILAVGDQVHRSVDEGKSWKSQVPLSVVGNQLPLSTEFFSIDTYQNIVILGSSQGLLVSEDEGLTWELLRVDYPLSGQHNTRPIDSVDGYIYPNPFSPTTHEFARIRFNVDEPMNVSVSIFDGQMRRIYQSNESVGSSGIYEVLWDGRTTNGLEVHNGVYFVQVEGKTMLFRGKILVVK